MHSSCLLKLFECYLLDFLSEKIYFNPRQFGYASGTSTTHSCLILKEIVKNYCRGKGKTYACFVDLSRAFDCVNHFKLGIKLLNRQIPSDIIKILLNYLRSQSARLHWGKSVGDYYMIEQGVRQGGILSAFLFKLYLDDLLNEVTLMNEGCKLGLSRVNILAYADDIVLISNSKSSLNNIYNVFNAGVTELDLIINNKKSKCIIFCNKKSESNEVRQLKLGNDNLKL